MQLWAPRIQLFTGGKLLAASKVVTTVSELFGPARLILRNALTQKRSYVTSPQAPLPAQHPSGVAFRTLPPPLITDVCPEPQKEPRVRLLGGGGRMSSKRPPDGASWTGCGWSVSYACAPLFSCESDKSIILSDFVQAPSRISSHRERTQLP
jgi:hypothetical protein